MKSYTRKRYWEHSKYNQQCTQKLSWYVHVQYDIPYLEKGTSNTRSMLGFHRIRLHKFAEVVANGEDIATSLCTRSERANKINADMMPW